MLTLKTARNAWHPTTEEDRVLVQQHLQEILRAVQFSNSKRYPAFLSYVVEQTLEGHAAQIKERTIGIEVFNRPSDYDTNNDTVVRNTAGEVRKRLALYNHDHDDALIEISMPQGSYVPEFAYRIDEHMPAAEEAPVRQEPIRETPVTAVAEPLAAEIVRLRKPRTVGWPIAVCILLLAAILGTLLLRRATPETALDRFWKPVFGHDGVPLLVPGGVVFSPNLYSGVETATKSDEYPFVSMQVAAALARVSSLMQQHQGKYAILPANSTSLADLRERPVVLLGAYNNPWTLRLLADTRLHLGPVSAPSILNQQHPEQTWHRDHSQPYASSDDYALIARLHDPTTGSPVVVIAGLGRNGTEAGAQYLTDPHHLMELEQRLGGPFADHNVEAVIKIKVVEGRTGAPTLETAVMW